MSTSLLIILLAALSLLLFAVEALLVPGFGLPGIAAAACAIAADVLVYTEYGTLPALLLFLAATAVVLFFLWWFSRSKALHAMSLQASIDSTNATSAQLSVRPGDRGVATTRLALIGNAAIDGKSVEVKSTGAFVDPGTPVIVVSVSEAQILVEPEHRA